MRSGGCVHFCSLAAVFHINVIHIPHQVERLCLSNMFKKRSAEIVCNIIFSVRKRAGSPETAHDRTAFTVDTAFYLIAVNRTFALVERMSRLKNSDL